MQILMSVIVIYWVCVMKKTLVKTMVIVRMITMTMMRVGVTKTKVGERIRRSQK